MICSFWFTRVAIPAQLYIRIEMEEILYPLYICVISIAQKDLEEPQQQNTG